MHASNYPGWMGRHFTTVQVLNPLVYHQIVSNHWTGLWTGLLDWTDGWITGLNLFISHDLHPIKCHKFGYSKHTSSSHCMLGNVHECTMHKLHGRMCIMNPWCTCSKLKAPSDYSKYAKRVSKIPTKASLLKPECHGEHWLYNGILVSGYQAMY